MPRPHLGRFNSLHSRGWYLLAALAGIAEDLIALLTLGWVVWDLRAWVLFDLYDRD